MTTLPVSAPQQPAIATSSGTTHTMPVSVAHGDGSSILVGYYAGSSTSSSYVLSSITSTGITWTLENVISSTAFGKLALFFGKPTATGTITTTLHTAGTTTNTNLFVGVQEFQTDNISPNWSFVNAVNSATAGTTSTAPLPPVMTLALGDLWWTGLTWDTGTATAEAPVSPDPLVNYSDVADGFYWVDSAPAGSDQWPARLSASASWVAQAIGLRPGGTPIPTSPLWVPPGVDLGTF